VDTQNLIIKGKPKQLTEYNDLLQTGWLEFYYKKSATVALYNDWLQNAQAVFNYTEHTREYD